MLKVCIIKASDYYWYELREMTAEQLLKLTEEFKMKIVVRRIEREMTFFDKNDNKINLGYINYEVTIYDDYLE